ncbi:MAG: hypothetical protein IKY61_04940, partial [Thermoguttaceae bacterium]|nr:hypothetical protein [Thermoguttaceae bacterium]
SKSMKRDYCFSFFMLVVALLNVSLVFANSPLGSAGAFSNDEVVTVATPPHKAEHPEVERFLALYPKEIYLGDPVYVVVYNYNASTETIAKFPAAFSYGLAIGAFDGTVACDVCNEIYRFAYEHETSAESMKVTPVKPLLPGELRPWNVQILEFPPLEDWDDPFWKTLRANLEGATSQSVTCRLTLKVPHYSLDGAFERLPVEFELVVKPRPTSGRFSETLWLDEWKRITPEAIFAKRIQKNGGYVKLPPFGVLRSCVSDIFIKERLYDPWAFVRRGNRKPSDSTAPQSLEGWRSLEARFQPSTLRDEITLTCLQLEYYKADEGEASDAALKALLEWLAQRPIPQRLALTQALLEKKWRFVYTDLKEKNAVLCDALTSALPVETPNSDDAK